MRHFICMLCMLVAWTFCAAPAGAEPTKDQLKEQFKARETQLRDMKKRGEVGETVDGYVDVVDAANASAEISKLLSEENKDRRALYQIIADEINKDNPKAAVKATMETIAVRNALRNMEKAGPDEMLRVEKGHWIAVKDYPRYQRLMRYKTQGKVGETSSGLIEIVKASDQSDSTLKALVEEENAQRNSEYKMLAEKEHVDAAAIAKRMGARNIENSKIGDMVKDEGGAWRKK